MSASGLLQQRSRNQSASSQGRGASQAVTLRIRRLRTLKLCNPRANGYRAGMTSPMPLIARLRSRLVKTVWLLAFVMLAKGTLASLCIVDGVAAAGESAQALQVAEATAAHAEDDGASCWHAGGGGCHCTCVHGSAIPVVALDWLAVPASSARIPLPPAATHPILIAPAFRPPIA